MTATTAAAVPQGRSGPSARVLAVRISVVLIAVAALLSPLYAALRGLDYLNQPPPPSWGVDVGNSTTSGSTGSTGTATSGGTTSSSGFGGC